MEGGRGVEHIAGRGGCGNFWYNKNRVQDLGHKHVNKAKEGEGIKLTPLTIFLALNFAA